MLIESMLANGQVGARHLSSNEEVHHYNAGPSEKMDRHVCEYRTKSEAGRAELGQWIAQITKANSKFGQVFNHEETVLYLETVWQYQPHFNVDPLFSVPFCISHLHKIYGGVSGVPIRLKLNTDS